MLRKLILKRLLPGIVLYYMFIQAYGIYNTSRGEPKDLAKVGKPAIAVASLPASVRANRKKMVEGLWDLYNFNPTVDFWDGFSDNLVFEEPNMRILGLRTLKKTFHLAKGVVERTGIFVERTKIKVKSEVHYQSRVRLEVDFEFTMALLGTQKINMAICLEFVKQGDIEKIVRLTEEWNQVPLITEENTLFPVGWSADRFRSMHGKFFEIICAFYS